VRYHLGFQFLGHFLENEPDGPHFLNHGHKRQENADFSVYTGPEQGAKLAAQNILTSQCEAYSPEPQSGVRLVQGLLGFENLVCAAVQSADDGPSRGIAHDFGVFEIELFLVGQFLSHKGKFGAVEADAVSSELAEFGRFLWPFDIGLDTDLEAVFRVSGPKGQATDIAFPCEIFVAAAGILRGIPVARLDKDIASEPVDDDRIAFAGGVLQPRNTDQGRDVKAAGKYGRV